MGVRVKQVFGSALKGNSGACSLEACRDERSWLCVPLRPAPNCT